MVTDVKGLRAAFIPGNQKQGLKIISEGQTRVDRAALDAALALGIPSSDWCPKGERLRMD
jgi:hypothetical protein